MSHDPIRRLLSGFACAAGLALAGCAGPASSNGPLPPSSIVPFTGGANPLPPDGIPVYDLAHLQRTAQPISQRRPEYPRALRDAGVSGQAVVQLIVDESGKTRNVAAVQATDPRFGAAAVDAVLHWRFRPAYLAGREVREQMQSRSFSA